MSSAGSFSVAELLGSHLAVLTAKPPFDVIHHHLLEIGRKRGAAQGGGFFPIDENRRGWLFAGAGQGDADVSVFRLARTVHNTAHHRNVERLHAWIARFPFRHGVTNE